MFVWQIWILLTAWLHVVYLLTEFFFIGGIFLYMHGQRMSVKNCMGAKCRLGGVVVTWVVCCLENYYKSAFNFL